MVPSLCFNCYCLVASMISLTHVCAMFQFNWFSFVCSVVDAWWTVSWWTVRRCPRAQHRYSERRRKRVSATHHEKADGGIIRNDDTVKFLFCFILLCESFVWVKLLVFFVSIVALFDTMRLWERQTASHTAVVRATKCGATRRNLVKRS